jgi:hypothetical protein
MRQVPHVALRDRRDVGGEPPASAPLRAAARVGVAAAEALKDAPLSRMSGWWKGWSARRAGTDTADALALLERGETIRSLHPAQDVVNDTLGYGVPVGEALVVINSDRMLFKPDALPRGLRSDSTATSLRISARDTAAPMTLRKAARHDTLFAFPSTIRGSGESLLPVRPFPGSPDLLGEAGGTLGPQ